MRTRPGHNRPRPRARAHSSSGPERALYAHLVASSLKRLLVGRPLPSSEEQHQRLGKVVALAVFASDAISSTAYATEEILLVLVPLAAMQALNYLIPIAIIVVVLLMIVISSY